MPVDKELPKPLYRVVGYRVCGERAVRVDILERLADLIRPLLAWRPGSPGAKPAGTVDGSGFVVTGSMTSLTGTSGEDFASILRSLGYRMERRPKPPEPAADAAQVSVVKSEEAAKETPATAAAPSPSGSPELHDTEEPEPNSLVPSEDGPQPAADAGGEIAETSAAPDPTEPAVAPDAEPAGIAARPDGTAVAGEEFIEVWRPGRPEHRRGDRARPRSTRRRERTDERRDSAPAAAAGKPSQPQAQAGLEKTGTPTPGARPRRPEREKRSSPGQPRTEGKVRHERAPDPNSPFAKLAALKAQLEAARKDRP